MSMLYKTHITRDNIIKSDVSPISNITPSFVGQICITGDNKVFFANGFTVNDWIEAGGSGEVLDGVLQEINSKTGNLNSLQTTNKSNLVEAINELFQSANSGKELIADAIGEPLSKNDTFSAMSDGINELLTTFKTNMIDNGVAVDSNDKFKQLIDKVATLSDNEGKGIQISVGTAKVTGDTVATSYEGLLGGTISCRNHLNINTDFRPNFVFVSCTTLYDEGEYYNAFLVDGILGVSLVAYHSAFSGYNEGMCAKIKDGVTFTSSSVKIPVYGSDLTYDYLLVGLGE